MSYNPFQTNQSVSGTINVASTLYVAQVNPTSVFIMNTPSVNGTMNIIGTPSISGTVIANQGGAWSTSIVGNASVSGTVGASIIGSVPINGSVTALQGTNPWVITGSVQTTATTVANQSVSGTVGSSTIGTVPVTQSGSWSTSVVGGVSILGGGVAVTNFPTTQNISGSVFATGSVTTLQGTNPWFVQLTSGSVITSGGNSSVQVVGVMPAQSVSGVGNFNASVVGTVPVTQTTSPWVVQLTSGSIATTAANSSVQLVGGTAMVGSITAYQGATAPWRVELTSGSIATTAGTTGNSSVQLLGSNALIGSVAQAGNWYHQPASVQLMAGTNNQGSVTTIQGTNPWTISNSSVMLTTGTNVVGSIAVLQSTNPWVVQLSSGSVITTGANSSVMLTQGTNTIGSVATLQGTNPWLTQIVGSVLNQYREDVAYTSMVADAISFRISDSSSLMAIVGPMHPLPVVGSISGTIATTQSGLWITSIAGTYAVNQTSTLNGLGMLVQGVRNDTMSSVISSVDGAYTPFMVGPIGELITAPAPITKWIAGATSINAGGSVAVLAAPGAGIYNYITGIQLGNSSASSVIVTMATGQNSVKSQTVVPAGNTMDIYYSPVAIKGTVAMGVTASIGSAAVVFVAMQGFTSKT